MSLTSQHQIYELSPLFRADRSPENNALRVLGGSGSGREVLEFTDSRLLNWLLGSTVPRDRSELEDSLVEHLSLVEVDEGRHLIGYFIEYGILVTSNVADQYRTKGIDWERQGWRDAFDFHYATTGLRFEKLYGSGLDRQLFESFLADESTGPQPPAFKDAPGKHTVAADSGAQPPTGERSSLGGALLRNLPVQSYSGAADLELAEVAAILGHSFGTQRTMNVMVLGLHQQKSFPSGGARHPLELYLAAREIDGLAPGLYHYHSLHRELRQIGGADTLNRAEAAAMRTPAASTAPALLFLTVRWFRHSWKYRYGRSYRMVLMEAGHAVQAIRLAGSAFGVDVHFSPSVDEKLTCDLLGIEDEWAESPLGVLGFGKGGTL